MPETPMIERVARLFCEFPHLRLIEIGPENGDRTMPLKWEDASEGDRQRCLAYAREILAAMREPTDAMTVDAAEHEARDGRSTSAHVWRAMIDAALAEVPPQ